MLAESRMTSPCRSKNWFMWGLCGAAVKGVNYWQFDPPPFITKHVAFSFEYEMQLGLPYETKRLFIKIYLQNSLLAGLRILFTNPISPANIYTIFFLFFYNICYLQQKKERKGKWVGVDHYLKDEGSIAWWISTTDQKK